MLNNLLKRKVVIVGLTILVIILILFFHEMYYNLAPNQIENVIKEEFSRQIFQEFGISEKANVNIKDIYIGNRRTIIGSVSTVKNREYINIAIFKEGLFNRYHLKMTLTELVKEEDFKHIHTVSNGFFSNLLILFGKNPDKKIKYASIQNHSQILENKFKLQIDIGSKDYYLIVLPTHNKFGVSFYDKDYNKIVQ